MTIVRMRCVTLVLVVKALEHLDRYLVGTRNEEDDLGDAL